MNEVFFVFPMAIALFIHAYSQCYFPPDSYIRRQAIGQPKEVSNGLHLHFLTLPHIPHFETLLPKPGYNTLYGQHGRDRTYTRLRSVRTGSVAQQPPCKYRELFARAWSDSNAS